MSECLLYYLKEGPTRSGESWDLLVYLDLSLLKLVFCEKQLFVLKRNISIEPDKLYCLVCSRALPCALLWMGVMHLCIVNLIAISHTGK